MRRVWPILAILTTLVTIVASPAFPFLTILLQSIPLVHASTRSITLVGYASTGWNMANPPITVTQGDTVMVTLSSGDGIMHSFVVDVDKDMPFFSSTGCPPAPDTDKCSPTFSSTIYPITYQFTVDFPPGTYSYYCSFHPATMIGNFIVQAPPPDFGVSSNPSSLTMLQGSKANSTITVTSVNNFVGSVTLSSSPSSPPGLLTSTFNVNPVMVSPGGAVKSNFTISVPAGTSPGSYIITVTAKNSTTFSHSTIVSVAVPTPDFSITPSPASVTINSGSSGTSTLTVTGSNGFSGTVSLATTVPSGSASIMLSAASVMLSPTAASATSTLTISSALGMFNVTVTATSGATAHFTQVTVSGPDFSITTSSTTVSVNQGSTARLTVTLSSLNGFSGSVALSAFPSSGGPPVTVSPTTLQVSSSGSVSATLTVTASASGAYSTPVSPGSYMITLNATMGSLSHTKTIPLTVTSPSSGAGILTSPIVIGGIAAAIAVVAGTVYVLRRRPKTKM